MSDSLVKKLAAVMAAVERIPKNGHNNFHNYDYATEADIVAAVRQELAKRHVMLIPAIVGREREPVGEKGSILTHLEMTFTFMDGETGEEKTFPWLGAGTDKEDKGAYKAMTGGEKYFLLKTFLIPTGDDPESDSSEDKPDGASRASRPPQAPERPEPAAPSGGLRVTNAKIGTKGTNAKGPWTLYVVTLSDGREATTFSKTIYAAASKARTEQREVDVTIEGKNLIALSPVFQQQEPPMDDDIPMYDDREA